MNFDPKISVVMSVYNGGDFLYESIQAILNQTFTDFEFIIIDDCSTDHTWKVLNDFAFNDKRLKIFQSEKNIGIEGFIRNLNFGCNKANGKYIARIDHDDISRKDRFQLQYDFLESNPDIFIVGAALTKIGKDGNDLGKMQAPLHNEELRSLMPKKISLYHPVIMFRKDFYQNFYREKMRYCEDYDFYLRIITDSLKMANLEQSLLQYRVLEDSMSRKQDKVIKNLFINQAKVFFKERLKKGKDSYESFDPNRFLNIYQDPSKELIIEAIQVSKKYYDFTGFVKLMNIYKKLYGNDNYYFRQQLLLHFGESNFLTFCRFSNYKS
ncbi:glycosyltransferase [Chryseobacterium sp. GP-SGM7]|uniref:glycosyltransferase n=1 Tax=Chryseobacterium sp. GP-SGM7 TaxID=3411323 RepID=UPI003B93B52C